MIKKYNLALLPMIKSEEVVNVSQSFSNMADKYLLGEHSLPHLTLYQFEIEESEVDNLWEKVREEWDEKSIDLVFEKFSCLTFDNNIYWVSLLPDHADILYEMHEKIADIINHPIKKYFDPHMTLISTKNKDYEKEVDKFSVHYKPVRDNFILKLGKCDDVGQFTDVVYQYDMRQKVTCKI